MCKENNGVGKNKLGENIFVLYTPMDVECF